MYFVAHSDLAHYLAQPYTEVVTTLIREHEPQIVLYGATTTGRDLAPRVASALRTGLTADCTDLRIGDHSLKGEEYKDLLYQIRPAFGGNIIATIISPLHRPQMATVREGVMVMPEEDRRRDGRIVAVPVTRAHDRIAVRAGVVLSDADFAVTLVKRVQEEKRVDLKGARIVVSGGVGVGSREGFALVEELARTVGGVVGASRAAVDAGWIAHDHQVGQTGTTVRPKLYIACGISGSVQHRAGMDQSARILAINDDPLAPIFSVAHYGVVGDLHKVIPLLIQAYKTKGAGGEAAPRARRSRRRCVVSNFFTDNPDLQHTLKSLDLARVVRLREDDYAQARDFAYAPKDYEDAVDSYARTLEIAGDLAGEYIEPRAEDVDRAGSELVQGEVCYAPGIAEGLERLKQADLMGITLPRKYGGLNFPVSVSVMIVEMVSRADPALMNIFGLQDISETVNKFADDEMKAAYLPRFASGEVTGSMALTEPEAGSDLQNVQLKAIEQPDGTWRLNGVKRFITNGCGQISLVLARSEEGTTDARGLSMFLYERDEHMRIRRLEDKLGIHGSPTCELQFDDAPALLVGERRRGLTTYVMSLMNGARIAIAAQAQGIAEAAYRAAAKYAAERIQFGAPIGELTAVKGLLADMRVNVEAARALLYETALIVDTKEVLEHRIAQLQAAEKAGEASPAGPDADIKALRAELKTYTRLAALYTPLAKACCTEMANQVTYDSLQVHGGSGYMRDFAVERYARDARITNIYEGTTQLQVVAAIGGILGGTLAGRLDEYDAEDFSATPELLARVRHARARLAEAIARVRELDDVRYRDFHARRLTEMAIDVNCGYLLLRAAQTDARRLLAAEYFVAAASARVEGAASQVLGGDPSMLDALTTLASG